MSPLLLASMLFVVTPFEAPQPVLTVYSETAEEDIIVSYENEYEPYTEQDTEYYEEEIMFAPIVTEPEWNEDDECYIAIDENGEEIRFVYWEDSEEDDDEEVNSDELDDYEEDEEDDLFT